MATTHTMSAFEFLQQDKPLPSLPSPTLTNPDMVLPSEVDVPPLPSPPRVRDRPPSPSYLREKTNEHVQTRSVAPKKERRGLMSRKLLLLRSRTNSGMAVNGAQQSIPRSAPSPSETPSPSSEEYGSAYASSPTLMDVGNLAPPDHSNQPDEKRVSMSGSSFNSDGMAGIPSFLSKYENNDGAATDDDFTDTDSPAQRKYGYSVSIEGGMEAKRKQQEEDEHHSAVLSKRAEQILANAKKRLNLMEGNLRGARDLVAPLTAANLKRATSLGPSHHSPYNSGRSRAVLDGYHYETASRQQPARKLQAQASSPTMGREYKGHARGFSDELPERASIALGRSNGPLRSGRIPVKANDGSWTQSLRSSRSYDSLGNGVVRPTSRGDRPLHSKGSPDSPLEPLPEDDGSQQASSVRGSRVVEDEQHDALGIYRPASRGDDLREQMSSLKGKISTLKERAREDSLRRQSIQHLRAPLPFNNASTSNPEYFYTQSPTYGSPVLDTEAGVGWTSQINSPASPRSSQKPWEQSRTLTGSRNAFAEQALSREEQANVIPERTASTKGRRQLAAEIKSSAPGLHRRTLSGTAIVQPASNRYSHHQEAPDEAVSVINNLETLEKPPLARSGSETSIVSSLPSNESPTPDYDHQISDIESENGTVYEDAPIDQPPVVAHEDRADAFDYQHFFLHSAMGGYGGRPSSTASEGSDTSVETAKQAAIADEFNPSSGLYPPPTPETPERLREIERNLHKRALSSDSVSTVESFATATEGANTPPLLSRSRSASDWPIPPSGIAAPRRGSRPSSRPSSRPGSQPNSRPSTAFKRPETREDRRDSGSERADSGIGIGLPRRPSIKSPNIAIASPPMSPVMNLHDPATLAVNALLNPSRRQLGLKDKALLFGLVESMRKVCHRLQEEDENEYETRVLRRRLDEARRALDGTLEQQRPGS